MRFSRVVPTVLTMLMIVLSGMPALGETPADYDINQPHNLKQEYLFAESALLVDEDSGEVLFSKNSKVRMYPASTTKIMTLMLALESGVDLESMVTIPQEAAQIAEGSSVIPVSPGDVMTFRDLLYGFMLSSGNDGANAIAVLTEGSIEAFVSHMNRRAEELGCQGTHYVNAHGYHDPEHYTTAQDLALISREAMRNPIFREIVAAPKWSLSIQRNGSQVNTNVISRNTLLQEESKYYYADCTGIKTGHHSKAGWCFVGSAEREGRRVICVVLNCEEEMSKWYDAARLFEYGFTRYAPVTLRSLLDPVIDQIDTVDITDADPGDPAGDVLKLELEQLQGVDQTIPLVSDSETSVNAALAKMTEGVTVQWERELRAPISAGERLGTLTIQMEGLAPVTAVLTASRDVLRMPEPTAAPERVDAGVPSSPAESSPDRGEYRASGGIRMSSLMIFAAPIVFLLACIAIAVKAQSAGTRRRKKKKRPHYPSHARTRNGVQRGRGRESNTTTRSRH